MSGNLNDAVNGNIAQVQDSGADKVKYVETVGDDVITVDANDILDTGTTSHQFENLDSSLNLMTDPDFQDEYYQPDTILAQAINVNFVDPSLETSLIDIAKYNNYDLFFSRYAELFAATDAWKGISPEGRQELVDNYDPVGLKRLYTSTKTHDDVLRLIEYALFVARMEYGLNGWKFLLDSRYVNAPQWFAASMFDGDFDPLVRYTVGKNDISGDGAALFPFNITPERMLSDLASSRVQGLSNTLTDKVRALIEDLEHDQSPIANFLRQLWTTTGLQLIILYATGVHKSKDWSTGYLSLHKYYAASNILK